MFARATDNKAKTFSIHDEEPVKPKNETDDGSPIFASAGAVADSKSIGGSFLSSGDGHDLYQRSEIDPVYHAKAHLLNDAFAEIGMGKYQVCPRWKAILYM